MYDNVRRCSSRSLVFVEKTRESEESNFRVLGGEKVNPFRQIAAISEALPVVARTATNRAR